MRARARARESSLYLDDLFVNGNVQIAFLSSSSNETTPKPNTQIEKKRFSLRLLLYSKYSTREMPGIELCNIFADEPSNSCKEFFSLMALAVSVRVRPAFNSV